MPNVKLEANGRIGGDERRELRRPAEGGAEVLDHEREAAGPGREGELPNRLDDLREHFLTRERSGHRPGWTFTSSAPIAANVPNAAPSNARAAARSGGNGDAIGR